MSIASARPGSSARSVTSVRVVLQQASSGLRRDRDALAAAVRPDHATAPPQSPDRFAADDRSPLALSPPRESATVPGDRLTTAVAPFGRVEPIAVAPRLDPLALPHSGPAALAVATIGAAAGLALVRHVRRRRSRPHSPS